MEPFWGVFKTSWPSLRHLEASRTIRGRFGTIWCRLGVVLGCPGARSRNTKDYQTHPLGPRPKILGDIRGLRRHGTKRQDEAPEINGTRQLIELCCVRRRWKPVFGDEAAHTPKPPSHLPHAQIIVPPPRPPFTSSPPRSPSAPPS